MKTRIKSTLLIVLDILIIFVLASPFIVSYAEGDNNEGGISGEIVYSIFIQGADTIEEGKTVQLEAYLKVQNDAITPENPSGATTTKISSGCIWSSSDESIATVSNTGLVTATKAGVVVITANHETDLNNLTTSHQITVTASSSNVDPNPPVELDWTDMSNASFNITKENSYFHINISGIQYKDNHTYYFVLSNSNVRPTGDNVKTVAVLEDKNQSVDINSYFELNGDIYMWFYEEYYSDVKQVKEHFSAIKLDRPALSPVGTRLYTYFFNIYTSSYLNEFNSSTDRKINFKIGHVNDINILKAIRDGKPNCLVDLLNYAKNADAVYTTQLPLGRAETITNNFDIANKQYFYVYMELDDENGKYYPIEDVSLYQGCVGESAGKNLFDYLDDSFKWELNDGDGGSGGSGNPGGTVTTTDPTQSPNILPNTGKELLIAVLAIVTVVSISSYFIYKKYKGI